MRRFDKLKVIKEVNEKIEKQFLNNKSFLTEQNDPVEEPTGEPDGGVPTSKGDNKSTPQENFNKLKTELGIKGDNESAEGTIPRGNGKKIEITSDGKYTIYKEDGITELENGTFKSVGTFLNKHIEFSKEGGNTTLKLKNVLANLDKEASTSKDSSNFYDSFKQIIDDTNKVRMVGDGYKYSFYVSKNGIKWDLWLYPDVSGEKGTFKFAFTEPGKGSSWLNGSSGKFSDYGETLMLDKPYKVVGIDKKKKIDSGIKQLLSIIYPDYK